MHPHAQLIDRLYRSLAAHDHDTMARCYRDDATFEDIAFRCQGRQQIHEMWRFVTRPEPKLLTTFEIIHADDQGVHVRLIDDYVFTDTQRPVINVIYSFFKFKDGLIIEHRDVCDSILWANMAMTGPKAWLAGHFGIVRSIAARKKLREFLREESQKSHAER